MGSEEEGSTVGGLMSRLLSLMTIFLPLVPVETAFWPLREPVEREARVERSLPMVRRWGGRMGEKVRGYRGGRCAKRVCGRGRVRLNSRAVSCEQGCEGR
ncbi:hypothetical protein KC19_VG200600 [Ceratodon purpureus]|uniref:Uncharacterized protein n=1 Tax=Ceratodon purpureus TaxID=3225 RepID=A0A8T0HS69_CERPU|nr:hypothetical protein KC19_VG200600 [Ceratodon purpureus]